MIWGSSLWTCVYYKKLTQTVASHYTSLSVCAPQLLPSRGPSGIRWGLYRLRRPGVAFTYGPCDNALLLLCIRLAAQRGWSGQNKRTLLHSFKNTDQAINWHTAPSVKSTPNSLDPIQIDGTFIQLQTLIKHVLRRQARFWTQNDGIQIPTLSLLGNKHWQVSLPQSFSISPTIKWEQYQWPAS